MEKKYLPPNVTGLRILIQMFFLEFFVLISTQKDLQDLNGSMGKCNKMLNNYE